MSPISSTSTIWCEPIFSPLPPGEGGAQRRVRVGVRPAFAVSMRASFARHSGESRNPAPCSCGSFRAQGFHSPCGRAGHFLCLCKESNQRNTPPVARSPGILPSDSARLLRGSLNAHPCACSERARILRALLRTFLRSLAAPQGAPFGRHPAAEAPARALFLCAGFIEKRTIVSTQCRDARIRAPTGAVRGAEHRRLRGISPKGRGDGSPRSRSSTGTVLSERPRVAEKRRAVRFAGSESDHRVRCLAFLVTFWAMPKSNRLARRARRTLCTPKKQHGAKSWIPAFAGMTSFRAFAATAGVGTAAIRKEATK